MFKKLFPIQNQKTKKKQTNNISNLCRANFQLAWLENFHYNERVANYNDDERNAKSAGEAEPYVGSVQAVGSLLA